MSGKITDHLKGKSKFISFEEGELWFQTETGLLFNIPADEVGAMTLNAVEDTTRLIRWVRAAWTVITTDEAEKAQKNEDKVLADA